MRDAIEGLMLALRWLWFPFFFPLGGIAMSTLGALVTYRGAARFRRDPSRPAMVTQAWAWGGMTVLTLCVLLVIGVAVIAPWGFLVFAAWLSLPAALIASSLLEARAVRRRTSSGTDVA